MYDLSNAFSVMVATKFRTTHCTHAQHAPYHTIPDELEADLTCVGKLALPAIQRVQDRFPTRPGS